MKNGMVISAICRQLKMVAERIDNMTMDIEQFEQSNDSMVKTYAGLRMDELEHAQVLTLRLTELIAQAEAEEPEVNTDEGGSAFAAGELTDNTVREPIEGNADCDDDK